MLKDKTAPLLEKIESFPPAPGVYLMKDNRGNIIYIGKAKALQKRVKSYYTDKETDRPLIHFLLKKVSDIDYVVTTTEKEALLLENNLIKKHKPKYNIELKDDKNYVSIMIDVNDDFPKLTVLRVRKKRPGALYFGPFSSARYVRETIKQLTKLFPLRQCSFNNFQKRTRPCLNFQIKRCLGPCCNHIDKKEYREIIDQVILFLEGKADLVVDHLEQKMNLHARNLEFEKAAAIRNQLTAIRTTLERQSVASHKDYNQDIIVCKEDKERWHFQIMIVRKGNVLDIVTYTWTHKPYTMEEIISTFLLQYYLNENREMPDEIILPVLISQADEIVELLKQARNKTVTLSAPQKGHKYNLLLIAQKNLENYISREATKKTNVWLELKDRLQLSYLPSIIECFDISNLSGTDAVGGVVAFQNNSFAKQRYRRYKIKTVNQVSDYAMMAEIINRHLNRLREKGDLPHIILIDGGKGHLRIAYDIIKNQQINNIALISIAKPLKNEEKYDKIYIPERKNPLNFKHQNAAYLLLQKIRDEAHRFAIGYHKTIRHNTTIHSILDEIEGIGEKKKQQLLKHFKSITAIKQASQEELQKVQGISKKLAQAIAQKLH